MRLPCSLKPNFIDTWNNICFISGENLDLFRLSNSTLRKWVAVSFSQNSNWNAINHCDGLSTWVSLTWRQYRVISLLCLSSFDYSLFSFTCFISAINRKDVNNYHNMKNKQKVVYLGFKREISQHISHVWCVLFNKYHDRREVGNRCINNYYEAMSIKLLEKVIWLRLNNCRFEWDGILVANVCLQCHSMFHQIDLW